MADILPGQHHVLFLFDPICPWAWRASLWIRVVARVRPVSIEWGLLSLEFLNQELEVNPFHDLHVKSRPALRLLALARDQFGNDAIDRLYLSLGELRHVQGRDLDETACLTEALRRADLPLTLQEEEARSNETLAETLRSSYERARMTGAFGVPTIYIDYAETPYFGPVIDSAPPEPKAGELWDLILRLSGHDYFYELKRERG